MRMSKRQIPTACGPSTAPPCACAWGPLLLGAAVPAVDVRQVSVRSQRQKDRLPCVHMAHHTPLLRKLKDVEMQYQHNKITNLKLAVAGWTGSWSSRGRR